MKKIILSILCVMACITSSLLAQSKMMAPKPFKPYCELEISNIFNIKGSLSPMMQNMEKPGLGGPYVEILDQDWATINIYPMVHKNSGYMLTLRYQYDRAHGITAKYGIVEDYQVTGHTEENTFDIHNQLSTASILYTVSTPNQRLKASGGPSYSWMDSKSVTQYNAEEGNLTTSGALGLNLNLSFSFIRSTHFHLAYYADWNMTGKIDVGPYDTGSSIWVAPYLPISTLKHGLTLGISI